MGAWAIGPFDNDDALDFVGELERQPNWDLVERALSVAAEERDYLELPEGAAAVAAAALVAGERLPDGLAKKYPTISERLQNPPSELAKLASRALVRALGEQSELLELWSEAEDYQAWRDGLAAIAERLKSPQ